MGYAVLFKIALPEGAPHGCLHWKLGVAGFTSCGFSGLQVKIYISAGYARKSLRRDNPKFCIMLDCDTKVFYDTIASDDAIS